MKAAVCNELIAGRPLVEACRLIARHGFKGIEIAPYTLADDPTRIPPIRIAELRRTIEDAGLACVGLHWLLKAPEGLHITTPDLAVRRRSWDCLRRLVDLCAGLGGGVMVLGSGRQRDACGTTPGEARVVLVEGLKNMACITEQAGVTILLEPLPSAVTDVVNTLSEAREVINAIRSPAVAGILDFHNCKEELQPWDQLVAKHFELIRHVHLNEADGYHPSPVLRSGRCRSDFLPAFQVLLRRGYSGWVSLEIFHADDPPAEVLQETRSFLDEVWGVLQVSR